MFGCALLELFLGGGQHTRGKAVLADDYLLAELPPPPLNLMGYSGPVASALPGPVAASVIHAICPSFSTKLQVAQNSHDRLGVLNRAFADLPHGFGPRDHEVLDLLAWLACRFA